MSRSTSGGVYDYDAQVLLNKIYGSTRVAQIGFCNVATSAAVPQDVWPAVGNQPLPTVATAMEVVSTSPNDTAAGSGAQAVIVTGLDASRNLVTQTVNLNGTTAVALPTPLIRVNQVRGTMVTPITGTQFNIGLITVRSSGGGTVWSRMSISAGVAQQTLYSVPAGYTLQIHNLELQIPSSAGGGNTRGADATLIFRSASGFATAARVISCTDVQPFVLEAGTYIPVLENSDFWVRVSYTSTNNMNIGCTWEGHLVKNQIP